MPAEEPNSFDPHDWTPPAPDHIAVLLPQYDVEALIGRGGMGAVYKAVQIQLKRPVAIKVLPAELAQTEQEAFVARFQREAQLLASLNHPGIVTIYDFGQMPGGSLYFVMEFVDGTDLNCLIRDKKLTPAEALKLATQICDALQFAHDNGVIHRDIKPANVLVTRDGRAKLADFGLALRPTDAVNQAPVIPLPQGMEADAHHREMAAMRYTRVGFVMGTPPYAAPEVYAGVADERSDIFALGIMLYEMLTGRPPEDGYLLPSQKIGVDRRVDKIITKSLEGDPDARFQKASEVKDAVENATKPLPKEEPPAKKPAAPPAQTAARSRPPSRPGVPVRPPGHSRRLAPPSSDANDRSSPGRWLGKLALCALMFLSAGAVYDAAQKWTLSKRLLSMMQSRPTSGISIEAPNGTAEVNEPRPEPKPAPVTVPTPTPPPQPKVTVTPTSPPPAPTPVVEKSKLMAFDDHVSEFIRKVFLPLSITSPGDCTAELHRWQDELLAEGRAKPETQREAYRAAYYLATVLASTAQERQNAKNPAQWEARTIALRPFVARLTSAFHSAK